MAAIQFHWADYVVFGVMLVLSCSIGVLFACTGQKQKSTEEYLMASRNMHVIPVAVSLFVSWLSAISCLGDPVEVYTYGAQYWLIGIGYCLAVPPIAHYFIPKYHALNLTSVNEFLEERFNRGIRLLSCLLGLAGTVSYLGIVLYAPALALNQVSGLPVWLSIVLLGTVCVFYTTLGGMKAVLWVDTLQLVVMLAGLLAILIRGTLKVGGIQQVWQTADRGGRLNFWDFNPDPLVRNTFWTYVIGGFFRVLGPFCSVQTFVQRYCTTKTARQAQLAVYLNLVLYAVCVSLFTLIGLVMYAYYQHCDPLSYQQITRPDQMLPLMVLDLLGSLPGVPGLFLACIFSASLSSLSSGFNAVAAYMLKDLVSPIYSFISRQPMADTKATMTAKIISVLFGGAVIGMAFLVHHSKGNVFPLTAKVLGAFGGPITGVFLMGHICPFVDSCSAFLGCVVSMGVSIWLGIGSFFHEIVTTQLPVSIEECENTDWSNSSLTTSLSWQSDSTDNISYTDSPSRPPNTGFVLTDLYHLSPLYFGVLGILLSFILGTFLGSITALCRKCRGRTKDSWRRRDVYHVQKTRLAEGVEIVPLNIERDTPYRKSSSFSRIPQESSDDLQPLTSRTPSYKGIYRSRPGFRVSDTSLVCQEPVGYRLSDQGQYRDDEPILRRYLSLPDGGKGHLHHQNSIPRNRSSDNIPDTEM